MNSSTSQMNLKSQIGLASDKSELENCTMRLGQLAAVRATINSFLQCRQEYLHLQQSQQFQSKSPLNSTIIGMSSNNRNSERLKFLIARMEKLQQQKLELDGNVHYLRLDIPDRQLQILLDTTNRLHARAYEKLLTMKAIKITGPPSSSSTLGSSPGSRSTATTTLKTFAGNGKSSVFLPAASIPLLPFAPPSPADFNTVVGGTDISTDKSVKKIGRPKRPKGTKGTKSDKRKGVKGVKLTKEEKLQLKLKVKEEKLKLKVKKEQIKNDNKNKNNKSNKNVESEEVKTTQLTKSDGKVVDVLSLLSDDDEDEPLTIATVESKEEKLTNGNGKKRKLAAIKPGKSPKVKPVKDKTAKPVKPIKSVKLSRTEREQAAAEAQLQAKLVYKRKVEEDEQMFVCQLLTEMQMFLECEWKMDIETLLLERTILTDYPALLTEEMHERTTIVWHQLHQLVVDKLFDRLKSSSTELAQLESLARSASSIKVNDDGSDGRLKISDPLNFGATEIIEIETVESDKHDERGTGPSEQIVEAAEVVEAAEEIVIESRVVDYYFNTCIDVLQVDAMKMKMDKYLLILYNDGYCNSSIQAADTSARIPILTEKTVEFLCEAQRLETVRILDGMLVAFQRGTMDCYNPQELMQLTQQVIERDQRNQLY